MTLKDIFRNSNGEGKVQPYGYILRADKLDSLQRVKYYDETASRLINEFKEYITVLEDYRKTLYDRAQFIVEAQMGYEMKLCIIRRVDYYSNRKFYDISIYKSYKAIGIEEEKILSEEFNGKERHKAIARFEELKKLYPNILTQKNIEKHKWER